MTTDVGKQEDKARLEKRNEVQKNLEVSLSHMADFLKQLKDQQLSDEDKADIIIIFEGAERTCKEAVKVMPPNQSQTLLELAAICTRVVERLHNDGWQEDRAFFMNCYIDFMESRQDIVVNETKVEIDDKTYSTMEKFDIKLPNIYEPIKSRLANLAEGHEDLKTARECFIRGLEYLKGRLPLLK